MVRQREADLERFPEYLWLSQNLVTFRAARGMNQSELARALGSGLDQSYVSAVERMKTNPTLEVLVAFARALGVTVADLLMKPDEEYYDQLFPDWRKKS